MFLINYFYFNKIKIKNISMSNSESKYDKNTYIGYLKLFNGGMKVIPGKIDNKIIHNRDRIIDHLNLVLSGGKELKEKNIEKYFKALGGKYIRSKMKLPESNNVNGGSTKTISSAHKLLKLASKNNLNIINVLDIFRGSAPQLYEKLETKISGGQVRDTGSVYSNSSRRSSYRSNSSRRSSYRSEGGTKSISTKSQPSSAALKTFGRAGLNEYNSYTADFREIIKNAGLDEMYIIDEDFFNKNPEIRREVIDNLKTSISASSGVGLKTQKGTVTRSYKDIMAFFSALSSAYKNETDKSYLGGLNNIIKKSLMPVLVRTKFRDIDNSIIGTEWSEESYTPWIKENFPTIYNSVYGSKGGYDDYRHGSYRSEGGYDDYRRDSYRSNNSRRSSYRSEGGYNDRRSSYRSEGGYNDRRSSYRLSGGRYIDKFSSKFKAFEVPVGFKYHIYLTNKENKIDRDSLVEEYRVSNGVPNLNDALIYLASIEAKWARNKSCESGNKDLCNKTQAEMFVLARKLYTQLKSANPRSNIDIIFEDEAPQLLMKIKDSKGGYDDYSHDSYRSNSGGYDDRDYNNRGGMNDDRDYNNIGGMNNDRDYEGGYRNRYYSDNMHGGALGEFRNEIGRNLFNNNVNKLRENILNIESD